MSKQILITGALESGIGEAVTSRMLSEGFHVVGTYEPKLSGVAVEKEVNPKLELIEVDHSCESSIDYLVGKLSGREFSGMINAQMFFNMECLSDFDHELWSKSVFVNMTMPNMLVRKLGSNLKEGSSVVFITSTEAYMGSFGASAYASSKAAVHNLVKTYANNFGDKKIRFNAVAAGWIGGVMDTDEIFEMSRNITPLGRLGDPSEISSVVNFLISDESSFVNASVVTADGGYSGVDTIAKFEYESEL
ncbi:SDR family NAD(P)-dependent oxidoreductase [Pseudoalteromonas maricaloris]|uniref:SDR family NAD(P)-dependent oxidoreductase n=1 Tax=Pseudoalteromonas maricaloris TaxID=184924 RepID=UPI003C2136E9